MRRVLGIMWFQLVPHPNSGSPEDTLLPDPVACVRGSAWWGVVVWVRVVQVVILCATEYRGGRMAL